MGLHRADEVKCDLSRRGYCAAVVQRHVTHESGLFRS